jgi:ankyrin repeat protein
MPTPLPLPSRPDLHWLKNRAKDRLTELRSREPSARLADAQLAIARDYGFPSWRALKARVDALRATSEPVPRPDAAAGATVDDALKAFLRAAAAGDADRVRQAITAAPALVDLPGPHPFWGGRPQALHVAIESDRREVFDLLLERGADVDGARGDYMHWTPLAVAIHSGRADMARDLIARGARVGLAEALMLGDDARVDAILDHDGARALATPAPNEGTYLHLATTTHAIDRLLALGVAPDTKDHWGATAIEALSRRGPAGVPLVAHLVARGVPAGPAELARLGDREALERLAATDPAAVIRPATLMAAVDLGHHELVRWLIQRGGDVAARTGVGSDGTPLHSASWNGDLEMVRLLLEAGADPNARDREHDTTPLRWAEVSQEVTRNPKCAEVADHLRPLTAT